MKPPVPTKKKYTFRGLSKTEWRDGKKYKSLEIHFCDEKEVFKIHAQTGKKNPTGTIIYLSKNATYVLHKMLDEIFSTK